MQEPAAAYPDDPSGPAPRTGHLDVDAVLAGVEALEGRPPADHVAVFETAHDRLRDLLSGAGESAPQPARG